MKEIVPIDPRQAAVNRPVRRRVAIPNQPLSLSQLPIDDVSRPHSFLHDDIPFISLEITCQRIETIGDQTHIEQRSLRMQDGIVETEHVRGTADVDAADKMRRYLMYETLGPIFAAMLPPRK